MVGRLCGVLAFGVLAFGRLACSSAGEPRHPALDEPTDRGTQQAISAPAIAAEIGALDQDAVDEAFKAARPTVARCFEEANRGLPFKVVGGDLEVVVRVKNDGTVRWAYPARSSLGHLGAERCIMTAMRQQAWPRPQGGEEGIARTRFGIDPPAPRPAVDWAPSDLGSDGERLLSKLHSCRRSAGTPLLSLTMYVDADGKVIAAGAAIGDEAGIDAVDCAVSAAKQLSYPSPGSYPAKVTLTVER